MPATRSHVAPIIELAAPSWKRVPGRGDYVWWDGSKYTTVAQWNGSSWTPTDLRPQPTTDPHLPGELGYHIAWVLDSILKALC